MILNLSYPVDHSKILNVKEKLLHGWQRRMSQKREGLHVSDLVFCRRRVCFEKLDTDLPAVDEKKIKYYWSGEYKQRALQELLGSDDFDCEKEVIWNGGPVRIIAHPDAIYKKDGAVIEFKTTESTRVIKIKSKSTELTESRSRSTGPYPHQIKQIKAYMSILGTPYGIFLKAALYNVFNRMT